MQVMKKDYKKLEATMTAKYEEIQALVGKFNQDTQKLWSEYQSLYEKLEETATDANSVLEKRISNMKRKISQVQADIGGVMAEAEKNLSKNLESVKKVPGVMKMLQQIM
ncbi:hypothetical protein CEUSTIGMA_g10211.t1 [Chlamydomonas eustigma]|uniref:Uncharacterized protein n=1 Tax=Chlamydomonas eustigma TaxID=1157962 RepID=A0A250XI66_9CHLO|nr:hypothetical protein CEUSTIGMA_g10211.t1 [Chlamydomonas eustigma]|eukprot:GAX82785.1 hypothetical protein CEUSTIGMA_g10211.t1 [Chlamydomonas eustigma]